MSEGPYLTAALICERIMEEKDRVLTAFRIMDSMVVNLPAGTPEDYPSEENRLPVPFDCLVSLKAGKATGEHTLRLDMISPSGKKTESETRRFHFPGGEHGTANLILHNTVSLMRGGLFHFDVIVDDKPVTRIPFRIDVNRQAARASAPSEAERPETKLLPEAKPLPE